MMKIIVGIVIVMVIGVGLVWLFWDQLPFQHIMPYVRQQQIPLEGNVQTVKFVGSEAGQQTYFIYLPKGYDSSDQSYPVLYHLHGAFARESWAKHDCDAIGSALEQAVDKGIVEPMIVVCAFDPAGNSMWSDSYDGQHPISTAFIKDLIPHIDATYRTIPERHGRALQGFSMGGFGAVTNGFRAPELFSAVIVWDGAIHNWTTLSTNRASIANKMFASEAYFEQWSPWALTENASDVDLDLFVVVGEMAATREFGSRFIPHLDAAGRTFIHYDIACPHNMSCMTDKLGDEAFRFLAERMIRPPENINQ